MTGAPIRFLTIDDVLRLHAIAIEDQGGDPTLRDRGLLESAIAQPRQQFGGAYLHPDMPSMAAAYAFHICKNHPFVDGNKRAAFAAMVAFLVDNDWAFDAAAEDSEGQILALADGTSDKADITAWLKQFTHKKPTLELREFFARLSLTEIMEKAGSFDPERGATANEFTASANPAVDAMPFLAELSDGFGRMSDEQRGAFMHDYAHFVKTFVALFRLAEDQGYEW